MRIPLIFRLAVLIFTLAPNASNSQDIKLEDLLKNECTTTGCFGTYIKGKGYKEVVEGKNAYKSQNEHLSTSHPNIKSPEIIRFIELDGKGVDITWSTPKLENYFNVTEQLKLFDYKFKEVLESGGIYWSLFTSAKYPKISALISYPEEKGPNDPFIIYEVKLLREL